MRLITGDDYMMTSQRRIALLAGASITALGIATPAFAAPHYPAPAPHDAVIDGPHPGTFDTTDDTISICNIGVGIPDNPDCFFGDRETGTGNQTANVTSTAAGQIHSTRASPVGVVDISITNAAYASDYPYHTAEIGAFASANGGSAFAYLTA